MTTTLPALPSLPEKYNPIKSLPDAEQKNLVAAIISHYEAGESIWDIAKALNLSDATLYRAIIKHSPDVWREVRSAKYLSETEQAEKELREASDTVAVSRARERLAAARWHLERLLRPIYGQDAGSKSGAAVQINIGIAPRLAQAIDVEADDN